MCDVSCSYGATRLGNLQLYRRVERHQFGVGQPAQRHIVREDGHRRAPCTDGQVARPRILLMRRLCRRMRDLQVMTRWTFDRARHRGHPSINRSRASRCSTAVRLSVSNSAVCRINHRLTLHAGSAHRALCSSAAARRLATIAYARLTGTGINDQFAACISSTLSQPMQRI